MTEWNDPQRFPAITIKTANEWIREVKRTPLPRQLFGELWSEGELAILFGASGSGKSLLAVQIAESIARGQSIQPTRMTADRQKVLLLDLELSAKQFEIRSSADHLGGRAKFLHNHYVFSTYFIRGEIDLSEAPMGNNLLFVAYFEGLVEKAITDSGAKVIILDNLTYLKRSFYGTRETLPLMQALNRVKRRMGLSILVLAKTHRHVNSQVLSIADLREARLWDRYADSIFAVGHCSGSVRKRYIKHIRQQTDEPVFTSSHLPVFGLSKLGGNFLAFDFERFDEEDRLLDDIRNDDEWKTIEVIKKLSDGGMTIRDIAEEHRISKTRAHRLLKMWRPPLENKDTEPSADIEAPQSNDRTQRSDYFPGVEEYDEAEEDERFDDLYLYGDDDHEGRLLAREAYLIEAAAARAHEIYNETGVAPKLAEDPDYAEFIECVMSGGNPFADNKSRAEPVAAAADRNLSQPSSLADGQIVEQDPSYWPPADTRRSDGPMPGLTRDLNGFGREIFVEKYDARGRPVIWYEYDSKKKIRRWERTSNGILGSAVEPVTNCARFAYRLPPAGS